MTTDDIDPSTCKTPAIQTGQVFRIWYPLAKPEPKYKFHVLVQIEPRTLYFFINSEVHPFKQANPLSAAHQIRIPVVTHGFLEYDSYLDCTETLGGPTASELEDGLTKGTIRLVGEIDFMQHRQARIVIEGSDLLPAKEINGILGAW